MSAQAPPAWQTASTPSKYSLVISGVAKAHPSCFHGQSVSCSAYLAFSLPPSAPTWKSPLPGELLAEASRMPVMRTLLAFLAKGGLSGCSQSFQVFMGRALSDYVAAQRRAPSQPHAPLSLGSCE